MGYIRHHTIIVTSYSDYIKPAYNKANELFRPLVSEITNSNINGYKSFFIAPDGSKEGWDDSNFFDEQRKKFIQFIDSLKYEDGSNSISYVELFYGDENGEAKIINHN